MKTKKIMALLLAGTMMSSMLAGCGNAETTDNSAATPADNGTVTSDTTSNDTAASGDVVTINVFRDTFNLASADSAEVKKVEEAINAYIADKINVKINLTDIGSGEYKDKAQLALANGEINLLWTASWMETINCDALVANQGVYDLTDLIKGSQLYDTMPEPIWAASRYEGKDYFVPCYKESAEGYNVMIRKDLVDKYNFDLSTIKTLADVEPMLQVLKEQEGLKYPFLTQKTALYYRWCLDDYDFFMQNSMIGVNRKTDAVECTIESDSYKNFCKLMSKWADLGYLSEDDLTKTTTDTTTQTKDWGVSYWTMVPNDAEANTRYKQEVVMAPVTQRYAHSTTTLGSCFCVTSNSTPEQAKACVDFLGLMYSDETLANLYTFGIEGVDYNMVDGKAQKTDAGLYNHSSWESGNVMAIGLEAGEPDNKKQLYEEFNNSAVASIAAGFRINKDNISAEWAACEQVWNEYGYTLENGGYAESEVEDAIKAYKDALDAAGFQTVLAEAQAQYDAWKATR